MEAETSKASMRFHVNSVSSCTDDSPFSEMPQSGGRSIRLGLCAMAKKVKSKPMTAILTRLHRFSHIEVVIFEEAAIVNEPIDTWPEVDALISFYSHGFPLDKVIQYADWRQPYLVNDLRAQNILMDREQVYKTLQQREIPVVRHVAFNRSDYEDPSTVLVEHEDHIVVAGEVFHKPFVEKPIDAEDHNIHIYFPSSAGGGSVRLFRKIGDRSSTYHSDCGIRRYGSYIYEEFMPTDGTDVKVYAIGKDYAHAEARKSPALDGKVERDAEGKEMRYPIILTAKEKIIAKKVVEAFSQNVCGFDLLRANGTSYVCDVNGFSFVKSSEKYYDDCAYMLCVMVTSAIAPCLSLSINYPAMDKPPLIRTTFGTVMELRCVIGVIRHADRTPKQKVKFEVLHPDFFALFNRFKRSATEAKLKKPSAMQELLNVVRSLLDLAETDKQAVKESLVKLRQVKMVLEMYGHFSGINRKAQLKFTPAKGEQQQQQQQQHTIINNKQNGKLLLVLKWGGELTDEGRCQAEKLGRAFRVIYPGGESYSQKDGLGLLRLHSTYRHDLKIYASDEGRVQTTAAAFAKGFLDLEGPLTPILVQMVKSANTDGLLDSDNDSRQYMAVVKEKIRASLEVDRDWSESDVTQLAPDRTVSLMQAMYHVGNPASRCRQMLENMRLICAKLEQLHKDPEWLGVTLYHDESWELALQRWRKLIKDFRSPAGRFDFSKVPDIYDNVKYDLLHNRRAVDTPEARQLYFMAKNMADIVVPSEYGITKDEKLVIAQHICSPLMRKILVDTQYTNALEVDDDCSSTRLNTALATEMRSVATECDLYSLNVSSPERFVRTRLYFTSESHIHSLLTILRYGGLMSNSTETDSQWTRAMEFCDAVPELNYLTQIVFMIYENPEQRLDSENRFHVELHFSPGCVGLDLDSKPPPPSSGFRPKAKLQRSMTTTNSTPRPTGKTASIKSDCTSSCQSESDTDQSLPTSPRSPATPATFNDQRRRAKQHKKLSRQSTASFGSSSESASPAKTRIGRFDLETQKMPMRQTMATDPIDQTARPRQNSWSEASSTRTSSRQQQSAAVAMTKLTDSIEHLNYGTYHGSVDFEKFIGSDILNSFLTGKQLTPHLISTNVIRGMGRSDPQLQSDQPASPTLEPVSRRGSSEANASVLGASDGSVVGNDEQTLDAAPCVPEIFPLETLHNSLTLRQLELFLHRVTTVRVKTPWNSRRHSVTSEEE